MTDLPSLLIGATLVVVGNVVIASLTHWFQSNREKKAHLWTAEEERKNRLRKAYAEIVQAGFTLQEIPKETIDQPSGETDIEHFNRVYKIIHAVRRDTLQARITIMLEDRNDEEVLTLLDAVEKAAFQYIAGFEENYKAGQQRPLPEFPPVSAKEFAAYRAEMTKHFQALTALLSDRLTIDPRKMRLRRKTISTQLRDKSSG